MTERVREYISIFWNYKNEFRGQIRNEVQDENKKIIWCVIICCNDNDVSDSFKL